MRRRNPKDHHLSYLPGSNHHAKWNDDLEGIGERSDRPTDWAANQRKARLKFISYVLTEKTRWTRSARFCSTDVDPSAARMT